ncbi:MAG: hypothetical protein WCK51_10605 [Armatimonadota bacterium]
MQDKKGMFAYEDGHTQTYFGKPKWVDPAYNVVCIYFIVMGLINIIQVLVAVSKIKEGDIAGALTWIGVGIYSLQVLFGIALLTKAQWVRDLTTYVCGVRIIFGLMNLLPALALTATGFWGFMGFIGVLFDLITNAMMIYLIGETDRK